MAEASGSTHLVRYELRRPAPSRSMSTLSHVERESKEAVHKLEFEINWASSEFCQGLDIPVIFTSGRQILKGFICQLGATNEVYDV